MKHARVLATATAAFLVVTAAPALATTQVSAPEPVIVGDVITDAFGLDDDQVTVLHEAGLGYGAIFKLQAYAAALGVDVETLLATMEVDPETGEYEFAWGEIKHSLTDEQRAILDSLPRNLGQLVSGDKRNSDHEKADKADKDDRPGKGRPEWAGGKGKPPHAGGDGDDDDAPDDDDDTDDEVDEADDD